MFSLRDRNKSQEIIIIFKHSVKREFLQTIFFTHFQSIFSSDNPYLKKIVVYFS